MACGPESIHRPRVAPGVLDFQEGKLQAHAPSRALHQARQLNEGILRHVMALVEAELRQAPAFREEFSHPIAAAPPPQESIRAAEQNIKAIGKADE